MLNGTTIWANKFLTIFGMNLPLLLWLFETAYSWYLVIYRKMINYSINNGPYINRRIPIFWMKFSDIQTDFSVHLKPPVRIHEVYIRRLKGVVYIQFQYTMVNSILVITSFNSNKCEMPNSNVVCQRLSIKIITNILFHIFYLTLYSLSLKWLLHLYLLLFIIFTTIYYIIYFITHIHKYINLVIIYLQYQKKYIYI